MDEYEILESQSLDATDARVIGTTTDQQFTVDKPLVQDNVFYYWVRAIGPGGTGPWSDAQEVVASYLDDFSGDDKEWKIRRQDLDDTTNYSYYENGHYVLEIDGRWDYALSSPLKRAPEPPYRISTSVFLAEPGNLNTYGIIFGGNWDGESECPNSQYGGCLSHYYRLLFIWFGSPDHMSVQLKRIDYHDENNQGRGETTIFEGVYRVAPPPSGYQPWSVEVHPDGTIRLFNGDNLRATGKDTAYINDPYFGVMAATDEYLGAEPHFDWYRVQRMNP